MPAEPGKLDVVDERFDASRPLAPAEHVAFAPVQNSYKPSAFVDVAADEGGGIMLAVKIRSCGELAQRPTMALDGCVRVGAGGESFEKDLRVCGNIL
jgi:hypothetical protein